MYKAVKKAVGNYAAWEMPKVVNYRGQIYDNSRMIKLPTSEYEENIKNIMNDEAKADDLSIAETAEQRNEAARIYEQIIARYSTIIQFTEDGENIHKNAVTRKDAAEEKLAKIKSITASGGKRRRKNTRRNNKRSKNTRRNHKRSKKTRRRRA